jgi:hypothetical protein
MFNDPSNKNPSQYREHLIYTKDLIIYLMNLLPRIYRQDYRNDQYKSSLKGAKPSYLNVDRDQFSPLRYVSALR